jgi:serine protease Do
MSISATPSRHSRLWTRGLLFLAAVSLTLSGGLTAPAQPKEKKDRAPVGDLLKSSPKILAAFRPVVAAPSQCTVRILCDDKEAALGTIVGPDGWILTKFSELKGKIVCRLKDGREFEARIVGIHDPHDLALLKVEVKGLTPVQWADSKSAAVGHWLASPGTGDDPVAIGVVSVATRNVPTKNVPRSPSSSGFLGVGLDPAELGAKINQIIPNSGAAKAGLKVNDQILAIAGKPVADQESFMNIIASFKPGEVIELKIKRGDQELELKATLGKRPPNRADVQNSLGSTLSERRAGFPVILQHDSVLKPTDCGGPLVDLDGKVVGINIARAGRVESYAVPSEVIVPLLADLMSGKLAPKPEPTSRAPTPDEKLAAAKAALQQAEADLAAAQKRLAEARAALQQAEAEAKTARAPEPKEK